jgi:hypothetical protein
LQKKKKRKDEEGRVTPVKKATVTHHKANKETSFKPAAPFKFADDFGWLVPDDYEVIINKIKENLHKKIKLTIQNCEKPTLRQFHDVTVNMLSVEFLFFL